MLAHALDYLNRRSDRHNVPIELEMEVVKCIKAIVNTKMGGKEAAEHPEYIYAVVFSIVCPQWQTRKPVCEILAFVCYLGGYEHVIRGFKLLQKYKKTLGLFDSWMHDLGVIAHISQKSKDHVTEYAVGKQYFLEEYEKKKVNYKQGMNLKTHLFFFTMVLYQMASMLLVNALAKVPSDVGYRVFIRNQLKTARLESSIIPKLKELDSSLLTKQIKIYKEETKRDLEEAYSDHNVDFTGLDQPKELFDNVLESISESKKTEKYLMSIMKHLLRIKGDLETR